MSTVRKGEDLRFSESETALIRTSETEAANGPRKARKVAFIGFLAMQ